MVRVDELIAVIANHDGQPISFDWRGRQYLAIGNPVRWYSRKSWWREIDAAPKGVGAAVIETEMWRVRAVSETDSGLFELRYNSLDDSWQLVQIHQ